MIQRLVSILKNASPLRTFILLASLFGLVFIIITPPFQTPDEPVHFYRAYQISTFNFIPDSHPGSLLGGGYMPSSLGQTVNLTAAKPDLRYNPNLKYDMHKTVKAFSIKLYSGGQRFYDTSSALFTPIMYIPQAIAIGIGRIFHAPPILLMYLARLSVLTLWVVTFAIVIKLMPRKKWAAVAIGLIPMALFQATSLGGDAMAIAFSSLLLTYILHLRDKGIFITSRQLLTLFLIASICVLSKGVTAIFLPFLLLIPASLLQNRKKAIIIKTILVILPLSLFVLWLVLIRGDNIASIATTPGAPDTHRQLQFILRNPFSYINVLWGTHFFYFRSDDIVQSFIGSFGWMDAPLSEWIATIGYLGLAILIFSKPDNSFDNKPGQWLSLNDKIIILASLVVYWLAVNTSMYVACSDVGHKLICGLQGRYFLPLVLPLVPVLYFSWLRITKTAYKSIAIALPTFLLACSVITIWFRYYVHMF